MGRTLAALLVTLAALALYLPLGSIQHDGNALNEVIKAEQGGPQLVSPNHLLYRPAASWLAARAPGPAEPVRRLRLFQVLTAFCAAAAAGLSFLALYQLAGRVGAAAVGAAWLATSHAFWAFSVDAFYITPAAMFLAAALVVALTSRVRPVLTPLLAGLLTGCAVLTWQGSVFALPGLAFLLARAEPREPHRSWISRTALFTVAAGSVSALALAAVGWSYLGHRSLTALVRWVASYGGGRLPNWGRWEPVRVPVAAWSAVRSLVPVPDLDHLRRLGTQPDGPTSWLPWLALLALLALATMAGLGLVGRRAVGPVVGYAAFLPFIVWWDPGEIKWFVLPNLFLTALVALGLGTRPARVTTVAACCVGLIAASVFWLRIWPQHAVESPSSRRAGCLAEKTTGNDLLVATDWSWCGEVSYLYRRDTLHVVDLVLGGHDRRQALTALAARVDRTHARGGEVYMLDLDRLPPSYRERLSRQTGLGPADWDRLEAEPAFVCEGLEFVRVISVRPAPVPHDNPR